MTSGFIKKDYNQGRKSMFKHGGDNIGVNIHPACRMYRAALFSRGVLGHVLPRNFFKMVQFGAFWCIFGSDFVFKKLQKLPFFIIKFFKFSFFI